MKTALTECRLELVERYFSAWQGKNSMALAALIHPEIHVWSPLAEFSGRKNFLTMVERLFPLLENVRLRSTWVSHLQGMATYDFVLQPPIGSIRTAALMTFDGGLICSVELFFDARPFERPQRAHGRQHAA
jgi:hypothetical protein